MFQSKGEVCFSLSLVPNATNSISLSLSLFAGGFSRLLLRSRAREPLIQVSIKASPAHQGGGRSLAGGHCLSLASQWPASQPAGRLASSAAQMAGAVQFPVMAEKGAGTTVSQFSRVSDHAKNRERHKFVEKYLSLWQTKNGIDREREISKHFPHTHPCTIATGRPSRLNVCVRLSVCLEPFSFGIQFTCPASAAKLEAERVCACVWLCEHRKGH